jgi:hypothetical protein
MSILTGVSRKLRTFSRYSLRLLVFLFVGGWCALSASADSGELTPQGLVCEGRVGPLGVDSQRPRLGWKLEAEHSRDRGLIQTAYQVLVASSSRALAAGKGDVWDSGKVMSAESMGVFYGGRPLVSSEHIFWKVRVWDQLGQPGVWSSAAEWTMGLLPPLDWGEARWIGLPSTNFQSELFRREFVVRRGLVRAVLHVTGVGQYEARLNGRKVGVDLFTPGWTDYRKTVLYDTYEVSESLRRGTNVVGMVLGNGMYEVRKEKGRYIKFSGSMGSPRAIALLCLEYGDGSVERLVTDGSWKACVGPETYSNVYGGEDYDARLEPLEWDSPGYDSVSWGTVEEIPAGEAVLKGGSAAGWPIRAFETLRPVAHRELGPGVTVFDLGQNAPLIPRLSVRGPAGSCVRLIPSELIRTNGEIDDTVCDGKAYWRYTLAGGGKETWQPRFFYRGARYLKVELMPAVPGGELPRVTSLEGVVVHADAPAAGRFSCSSDLLNRIYTLVRWAQRGNMMSVLTDCPHREKLGWLEQDYLNGPALRYNFDLNQLFSKTVDDVGDSQLPSGLVANIAPEYTVFGWWGKTQFRESPEWGAAYIQVPWQQFLYAGDLEPARRHYEGMKAYMKYLGGFVNKDGLLSVPGSLGDWYDVGTNAPGVAQLTPVELSGTALYWDDARIMAELATKLGKADDAQFFEALGSRTRAAFEQRYFKAESGSYSTGSQTANALPLALGMVKPENRGRVLASVVADIQKNGLTAGDVGYRYLLRALADGGRSDVVWDMIQQTNRPGYAMQLARGATSLTESWDARRAASQNHFMLGQINEWFFHDLAGIQPDAEAPGFARVLVKPAVLPGLDWVKAEYDSVRGPVRVEWRRKRDKLELRVSVPAGAAASIFVPGTSPERVRESGRRLGEVQGVRWLRTEPGYVVLEAGSGEYRFTVER